VTALHCETTPRREPSAGRAGTKSTLAAFAANLGIAAAKFLAWLFTGSPSMLAEFVHSCADSSNQGLMLWGQHRARRRPSAEHPFGFGRERYFWAFVVAMVLFSGGALFALVEGEEKLRRPHELSSYPWAATVLLVGAILEGVSLRTAVRESRRRKSADESWWQFIRRTAVPELAVIVLEDFGALIGLALAFFGTTAATLTEEPRFDAVGSVGIGILLAAIATTLAVEMKSLLIGEAATPGEVAAICAAISGTAGVVRVADLRTEYLGPDDLLVVGAFEARASTADDLVAVSDRAEEAVRAAQHKVRLVYLRARRVADEAPPDQPPEGPECERASSWHAS
jgi:cation diffusion facilitator family transporter